MADRPADKLDPRATGIIVFLGVVEFELFVMGREIVNAAQQDAWLSILLGGLLSMLLTFFLLRLAIRFPGENLFQFGQRVLGKPLSVLLALVYFLFWAFFLTLLFRNYTEANRTLFLPRTPALVPLLLLALGAIWLASAGLFALTRFFQIVLPFLFVPLLFGTALGFSKIKWDELLPIMAHGVWPVVKGALIYLGYLQGLEVVLFFGPFLGDLRKAQLPVLAGTGALSLMGIMQVLPVIGVLGVPSAKGLIWPSTTLFGALEIPLLPVERFELWLTLPWLVGIFTTVALILYLLARGIDQVFSLRRPLLTMTVVGISVLAASYLIPNLAWTMRLRSMLHAVTLGVVFALPLLVSLVAVLRRRGGSAA